MFKPILAAKLIMNRRLFQRCTAWLLPLLVLQSLVPVGFMVVEGDRGLEVAFCPVQSARVVSVLAQWKQATHHDHSAHHGHAGDDTAHDARGSSCPYAFAATAIVAHAQLIVAASIVDLGIVQSREVATPRVALPPNSNRIRGPPPLSLV